MNKRATTALCTTLLALAAAGTSTPARAFCGFYVSGAETKLTNNATQVVMMREGTRTVLAMQNGYQGPPQDFAMVVPVPVVLQKENVKTLTKDVFDHVDKLTAPRLVEYWEQDPCPRPMPGGLAGIGGGGGGAGFGTGSGRMGAAHSAVRIEAQFTVGEYEIVVLSATDSTALDAWLRQNGYKIPAGAEPYLRPYVQMGMKFFVAKVDVSKVRFERVGNGPEQAILSPLRFHYDSDSFNLPIRLGLINSGGKQDLVVTILAPGQRYEVANYDNVAIPTNLDVSNATRERFASFYAELFDQTLAKHPRSVVTEYSWMSSSCDPCPTPPLGGNDLRTLGADVMPSQSTGGFVVTRLHARYSKDALGDDQRGIWGGPPGGSAPATQAAAKIAFVPRGAPLQLAAFVRGTPAETFLSGGGPTPVLAIPTTPPPGPGDADASAPDAGGAVIDASTADVDQATLHGDGVPAPPAQPPPTPPPQGGCGGCNTAPGGDCVAAGSLLALAFFWMTRRRR